MRRLLVPLLVAALLAPAARAGAPLAGEVAWGDDASLTGALEARAYLGRLDFRADAEGARVAWSAARGYRVEAEALHGSVGPSHRADPANESFDWGAGSLVLSSCDACLVVVWVEGRGDGAVGVAGEAHGPLARAQVDRKADAGLAGSRHVVSYGVREAWLAPPPMGDARPFAEGRVLLYLWGVTARVETEAGTRELWTGARSESAGPETVPVWRTRRAEAWLELEDARLEAAGGRLTGASLDVALAGEARASSASGWLSLDGRRVALAREPLTLEGDLRLVARAADAGQSVGLGGEAERVVVAGESVRAPVPASVGAPLAAGGGLLAVLVAWRALAPLYSRLTRADVLRNPNRARVYAAVCASPGAHVAALSRATGVGRVVLQHHLRMLAAHQLVVARDVGRLSMWFPTGAALRAEDVAAEGALRDATRRQVALLVLSSGGTTQKEVAARVGISQRLASYHLGQLEAAGLVTREGWRPARFVPTPMLRERLPRPTLGAP